MHNKTDTIFSEPRATSPFTFDKSVAEVFPDMIKRSVPGYKEILRNLASFAEFYVKPDTRCYDLGCSLGAASLSMSSGITAKNVDIIAVDNSKPMLERCQRHLDAFKHPTPIELVQDDIQKISIDNASMVVLNFTLQFIPTCEREAMLENIYHGLNPGGILIISEKISFEEPQMNQLMIELHHRFKKDNGYSDLEVSQKRNALENVLLPESLPHHLNRLKKIGFSNASCWFQQYNFSSIVAIK